MVQLRQQLSIEPMREGDVPVVQEIEREIFSTPWPRNAYYRELASRNTAHYIVLRRDNKVIGWRRGYYTDNGEDAIVMWSDSIYSPRFRRAFEENLARIDADVAGLRRDPPLA